MGTGLIVVKKVFEGEEFSNTYAFSNESGLAQLGPADLIAVGADVEISDASTDPTGDPVAAFLLHRVIAFDRLLTSVLVSYREVYITDGTRNETDPGNVFYTSALDFQGLFSTPAPIAGSITLLIQRVPAGFSSRKGRLYMRGALDESEVRFGGPNLVTWQTPGNRTSVIARVNNAVTNSGLGTHFADEFGAVGPTLVIPHYEAVELPEGKTGRNLVGGSPIARLVAADPTPRQVKKGRKEKKDA